jgi:hypothetical protein
MVVDTAIQGSAPSERRALLHSLPAIALLFGWVGIGDLIDLLCCWTPHGSVIWVWAKTKAFDRGELTSGGMKGAVGM